MKIGIDAQTTMGQKTGFGFYVKNLVENLKKIDKKNQYFLFKPKASCDFSAPKRFIWDQIRISKLAKEKKVDILHQPCFSLPLFYGGKIVATIHDLIAVKYGEDIPFFSRMYFSKWMPLTYKKADAIISISEHTKRDIIKYFRIPEEKITVIYEAANASYKKIDDQKGIGDVRKKYQTGDKYLLHIGTLNPRKNLLFLVDVFSEVIKKHKDYNLVIVGKEGWYFDQLYEKVKKLDLKNKIRFTGYIDEKDKAYLYNGASLFVFPSLYEGFGLPPLEAMSCGIPVISSKTSSMPEVVGDAGILLSPNDKKSWIKNINNVLSDKKLQKQMSEKSLERAKYFSWEKCAKQTLKVYERLYNQTEK